jgi:hypothetical protein
MTAIIKNNVENNLLNTDIMIDDTLIKFLQFYKLKRYEEIESSIIKKGKGETL